MKEQQLAATWNNKDQGEEDGADDTDDTSVKIKSVDPEPRAELSSNSISHPEAEVKRGERDGADGTSVKIESVELESRAELPETDVKQGKGDGTDGTSVEIDFLRHPQQGDGTLDCGAGAILHMYMECCSSQTAATFLPDLREYRNNIIHALQTHDGRMLDPARDLSVGDNLVAPEDLNEWSSQQEWTNLTSGGRLSDTIIHAACKLIKNIHEDFIANQMIHSGPVYIFDPFFANRILENSSENILSRLALKFVHANLLEATKVIVPVIHSDHIVVFAFDVIHSDHMWSSIRFRLHDTMTALTMTPSRHEMGEKIGAFLTHVALPYARSEIDSSSNGWVDADGTFRGHHSKNVDVLPVELGIKIQEIQGDCTNLGLVAGVQKLTEVAQKSATAARALLARFTDWQRNPEKPLFLVMPVHMDGEQVAAEIHLMRRGRGEAATTHVVVGIQSREKLEQSKVTSAHWFLCGLHALLRHHWTRFVPDAIEEQVFSIHLPARIASFVADRLSLARPSEADLNPTPVAQANMRVTLVDSHELLERLAHASNANRMPKVQAWQLRQVIANDLTYNPPKMLANMLPDATDLADYLASFKTRGTHVGQPAILAISARFDCPVVVLRVPDQLGPLQLLSLHGRNTAGLPIFLLLFHPGSPSAHYGLAIPSEISHYQKQLTAAKHLVEVDPINVMVPVGSDIMKMAVFGVAGDGNCFFSVSDLATKARNPLYQEDGTFFSTITTRYCAPIAHDDPLMSRLKVVQSLLARNPRIKEERSLAYTSANGHAWGESSPASCLKKDKLRDEHGVGLGLPYSVFLDCGAGTLCLLLTQAQLYPHLLCVGLEVEPQMHHRGLRILEEALRSEDFEGRLATRNLDALDAGSLRFVTNVGLYDGTCSTVDNLDPKHIELIAKLMDTESIVEFTTTKLGSLPLVREYVRRNLVIKAKLPEFDILHVKNCGQAVDRLASFMFVRKRLFRRDRGPVESVANSPVNAMIVGLSQTYPRKSADMYQTSILNGKAGVHGIIRADQDGELHTLMIGLATVHCIRTCMKFEYGCAAVHKPTRETCIWLGGKMAPQAAGQNEGNFSAFLVKIERKEESEPAFWLVSKEDLELLKDHAPSHLSTYKTSLKTMAKLVSEGGTLVNMQDEAGTTKGGAQLLRRSQRSSASRKRDRDGDVEGDCNEKDIVYGDEEQRRVSPRTAVPRKRGRDVDEEGDYDGDEQRRSSRLRLNEEKKKAMEEEAELQQQLQDAKTANVVLRKNLERTQMSSATKRHKLTEMTKEVETMTKALDAVRKKNTRRTHALDAAREENDTSASPPGSKVGEPAQVHRRGKVKSSLASPPGSTGGNSSPHTPNVYTSEILAGLEAKVVGSLNKHLEAIPIHLKAIPTDLARQFRLPDAIQKAVQEQSSSVVEKLTMTNNKVAEGLSAMNVVADTIINVDTEISQRLTDMESAATAITMVDGNLQNSVESMQQLSNELRHEALEKGRASEALGRGLEGITSNVANLASLAKQLTHKLDQQSEQIVSQRLSEVEAKMTQHLLHATHRQDQASQEMRLHWERFATRQEEGRHQHTISRVEAGLSNHVPAWLASERTALQSQSMALQALGGNNNGGGLNNLVPALFERLLPRASLDPNPRGAWAIGGEVPASAVHVSRPAAVSGSASAHADLGWKNWGPREIKKWMMDGACDALAHLLFPVDANKEPPITIKVGSQLEILDDDFIAQIQGENPAVKDLGLEFAKRTFKVLLKKLRNEEGVGGLVQ